MTHIVRLLTALSLALALFATTGTAMAEGYGKQKVVYHINYNGGEGNKAYKGAMRNIQNHINAVGAENMEIKVVMHGNGLGLLSAAKGDPTMQTTVSSLKGQNVAFHVCNNTLVGRKIDYSEDLYDVWEDDIVPSGVAELSKLQQMGFTYIKP
ncbi:DsrE family protein [Mameliella sediminis]|uniref:DsrE family protein n=1 Tax=Mameliella sediminis TaxID=2836866 RepID=UPI001C44BCBF|nr:DsrE family protein [Mameliella sediminis]MBY6114105.1 DsrE family protein [Antarctobacter heliothermus]MBY6142547.1 DsrE family protein [Mameliella alba]MBV7395402.1 DsrE family protein [Mameliella sediminis]MBY6159375.1 DsrE family protein [Mameliella alba]MBY6167846.1 DsrE family protein [Mameliella alba]